MKEFNLQDTLRVSDSKIKGFVVMQDQEGKTIFAKSNMIVEAGRNYIMDLVYEQLDDQSNVYKFSSIKFGTSNLTSTPGMTALQTIDATISAITVDITTLVWSESLVYTQGLDDDRPSGTYTGEIYYATDTDEMYTYTAEATNAWDNVIGSGTTVTTGLVLPATVAFGNYFYKTSNIKLYRTARVLEKIPTNVGLGLKITIDVVGNASASDAVTELGLFLDSGTLFSRVVFDAIPLTDGFSYKLTYYIYF